MPRATHLRRAGTAAGYQRTWLSCAACGAVFPLWRLRGHARAFGHRKHLYCVRCRRVTPHVERVRVYQPSVPRVWRPRRRSGGCAS
jgi:hypothetical protein